MTRAAYYHYIRSLDAFPAIDAYRLAGEAAQLDEARQIERTKVSKREVSYEGLFISNDAVFATVKESTMFREGQEPRGIIHTCLNNEMSDNPSWWENDYRGIPLCRVCDDCRETKLACYRPEILTGYDQGDVDEAIEAEE